MALKNNPFAKPRTFPRRPSQRQREAELIQKGLLPPIPGDPFFDVKPHEPEPTPSATQGGECTVEPSDI